MFYKLATRLFDLDVPRPRPGDPVISDAIGHFDSTRHKLVGLHMLS